MNQKMRHDSAFFAGLWAKIATARQEAFWLTASVPHKRCALLSKSCGAAGLKFGYFIARHPGPPRLAFSHRNITSSYSTMKTRLLLTTSLVLLAAPVLGLAAPVAENWDNHCTKCHGDDGKGQTKAGKKLQLRDYTDAKVQAEMKDEDMIKAITDGISDKAGKEKMKAYKDELSADEIKALVAHIRKFKS